MHLCPRRPGARCPPCPSLPEGGLSNGFHEVDRSRSYRSVRADSRRHRGFQRPGLVTARELARAGARVVLAVRDPEKGQRVAAGIPGRTEVRPLDLASLASVRAFAAGWTGTLDILVNNAGIMAVPQGRTADGFELQIGTNHLGPFLLTGLLLPVITDRVVTVSSQLHRRGRIDLEDLNWEHRRYNATGAYTASKLANVLFTLELQRQADRSRQPGAGRDCPSRVCAGTAWGTRRTGSPGGVPGCTRSSINDAEHGALPTLYAVTQDIPGRILHRAGRPGSPSRLPRDPAAVQARTGTQWTARLWDLSAPAYRRRAGGAGRSAHDRPAVTAGAWAGRAGDHRSADGRSCATERQAI